MWLVTYFLITWFHKITEAVSVKNILVKTVGSNDVGSQQYSRKFIKMAAISSMKITFLDSFLQTCAISMILVSTHAYVTTQQTWDISPTLIGLLLAHGLWRCRPNRKPTLGQRLMFAG